MWTVGGRFAGLVILALGFAGSGMAQPVGEITGTYCLGGVREVGSCFRFNSDQTFEFFLSYGAYDQSSEGRWRLEGNDVVLDGPSFDRKPSFVFRESRPGEGSGPVVLVLGPAGNGLAGVDVRVRCDGRAHEGYTQSYGYALPCTSLPDELALGIRMYGLDFQPIAVPGGVGGRRTLVFQFEPGDLGKTSFAGTRLRWEAGRVVLIYANPALRDLDGRSLVYRKH